MNVEFIYQLAEEDKIRIAQFYKSQKWVTIEQRQDWTSSLDPATKVCYFIASVNNNTIATAVIEEFSGSMISTASISFGPLFSDPSIAASSIQEIYIYYKKKKFALLTIQPGFPTGPDADFLEFIINENLPVNYYYDKNNWSSLVIDLSRTEEELMKNMSKGHKSDIKKAAKLGLTVTEDFTEAQFEEFRIIFTKMHKERNLPDPPGGSDFFLNKIKNILEKTSSGKFILVVSDEQKIIGGIAVIYQGKTVRYFKGAADPGVRSLPVLHLAIWEGIKRAALQGFEQFDLWGYNHYAKEPDQIFFINRFKKGFGGSFIFYPKKMYFILKPLQYKIYLGVQHIYRRFFKS
jgi:hypothetical protein